ncbi:MAG: glycine C-acetyltransferase [Candidatus Latescibacterota bacterium]|jgi:glycine C-acetyltransferase
MAYSNMQKHLQKELQTITDNGLLKVEQQITTPQGSDISTTSGNTINFCANNYLGLANHPDIVAAAHDALNTHGYGMASVRFICGTQQLHKNLERKIADFLSTDDTILYSSCFDANGGLFETLLSSEDAIISASLNHASIIDGVRLCKAQRFVYKYDDMADLETQLQKATSTRFRMIATDGVFSMHGDLAPLDKVCDLAEQYDALVMVDDSHATGFLGPNGRGTPEHFGVLDRIDILTSTLGKALGGASGGFTTGRQEIIDFLRQRSRPYLFSNTLAPPITAASIKALELVQQNPHLRKTLFANTHYFREQMTLRGFQIKAGIHPIVPIMLGDEKRTVTMAKMINERGIFAVGFSYPVVPKGEARIRVQISAAHTQTQLDKAIAVFEETGKAVGVI